MEAKVILFHSNESDKCKAFINNDVSLITSKNGKDDIWLGDGMYFGIIRGMLIGGIVSNVTGNQMKLFNCKG